MRVLGNVPGNLVEMQLHCSGICEGQRQCRSCAPGRADGAEQVGAFIALVGGLDGSCATPGPLTDEAVLLADTGFVLEPDLDLFPARHAGKVGRERAREVFLNAWMTSPSCLGCRGLALT